MDTLPVWLTTCIFLVPLLIAIPLAVWAQIKIHRQPRKVRRKRLLLFMTIFLLILLYFFFLKEGMGIPHFWHDPFRYQIPYYFFLILILFEFFYGFFRKNEADLLEEKEREHTEGEK